ncbi:MAG: hypothetical protein AAF995_05525 [Planctomycetota bacterium]
MSRHPDPLDRFLSVPEGDRHPARILRLTVERPSREDIERALARRLAEIDNHPWASTPEADEARLAVHAAAAQLADPDVSRSLQPAASPVAKRNDAVRTRTPKRARAPVCRTPSSARQLPAMSPFQRDAMLALALAGGWKPALLRRLVLLAHVHRVEPEHIPGLLRRLAGPARSGGAAPLASASAVPSVGAQAISPARDPVLTLLVGMLAGVIVLTAIAIPLLARGPRVEPIAKVAPPEQAAATLAEASERSGVDAQGDSTRTDRELAFLLRDEPRPTEAAAAARTLRDWVQRIALRLTQMPSAVLEDVVHELHASGAALAQLDPTGRTLDDALGPFLAPLRSSASSISPQPITLDRGVLTGSIAAHVANDPASPRRAAEAAATMLSRAGIERRPRALETGGAATLAAFADALAPDDLDAWRRWLSLTAREPLISPRARAVLRREAIAGVVVRGVAPGDAARPVAALLTNAIDWRRDTAAQRWISRSVRSEQPITPTLTAVIETLATTSAVPGIGPNLVLAETASRETRERVAAALDQAWAQLGGVDDPFVRAWLDRYADLQSRAGDPASDTASSAETLRLVAQFAELSASAHHRTDGDTGHAAAAFDHTQDEALDEFRGLPDATGPKPGGDEGEGMQASASWALRYLRAGSNTAQRLAALGDRAANGGSFSAFEARVIAREAFRGSPRSIRELAGEVLTRHAGEPHALEATLDMLSDAPRSEHSAELIALLVGSDEPLIDGPDWHVRVRAVLLSRLLGELGEAGLGDEIDLAAGEIAAAYAARLGEGGANGRPAHALAARVRESMVGSDSPYLPTSLAPSAIERRRLTRAVLAADVVERFGVEQRAIAELLAAAVIADAPARSASIEDAMRELDAAIARAGTLPEQLLLVERARADLWRRTLEDN